TFHHIRHRNDWIGWKLDMTKNISRLINHMTQQQWQQFKLRIYSSLDFIEKLSEQVVMLRQGEFEHNKRPFRNDFILAILYLGKHRYYHLYKSFLGR
ncbi:hypothetical protein UF06_22690, partial [Vibrio sp. S234-5]